MENHFTLFDALNSFQGAGGDEELLQEHFEKIAQSLFFGGFLSVNDRLRIFFSDIEFYYHEEAAHGIKDFAMYHTNEHSGKSSSLTYFPLGSFNAHVSGVDVTFENEKKQFRASFLVRGIKIVDENGQVSFETRPTYVYEYLLMNQSIFSGIKICWINKPAKPATLKRAVRKNICQYDANGQRIEYKPGIPCSKVKIGHNIYCQCPRLWRFYLEKENDYR